MKIVYIKIISFCIVFLLIGNEAIAQIPYCQNSHPACTTTPQLSGASDIVLVCLDNAAGHVVFNNGASGVQYQLYQDAANNPVGQPFNGDETHSPDPSGKRLAVTAGHNYFVRALEETGKPCSCGYTSSTTTVAAKAPGNLSITIDSPGSPFFCAGSPALTLERMEVSLQIIRGRQELPEQITSHTLQQLTLRSPSTEWRPSAVTRLHSRDTSNNFRPHRRARHHRPW